MPRTKSSPYSGLVGFDRVVSKLRPALYVLRGPPGVGKTTLLLQVAHHLYDEHDLVSTYLNTDPSFDAQRLADLRWARLRTHASVGGVRLLDLGAASHVDRSVLVHTLITRAAPEHDRGIFIVDSFHGVLNRSERPGNELRATLFWLAYIAGETRQAIFLCVHDDRSLIAQIVEETPLSRDLGVLSLAPVGGRAPKALMQLSRRLDGCDPPTARLRMTKRGFVDVEDDA